MNGVCGQHLWALFTNNQRATLAGDGRDERASINLVDNALYQQREQDVWLCKIEFQSEVSLESEIT